MITKLAATACVALFVSVGIAGCAADSSTEQTPGAPAAESTTTTPAPAKASGTTVDERGPVSALPADGAASRGTVVGTVMASDATQKATGVTVWGTFKQSGTITTYGFDKDGVILSKLTLARGANPGEVVLTAPGTGLLRLAKDGTVVENTLKLSNKLALDAMGSDFQATGENAAYGWFTWVRTGVFCAIAGGFAGVNVAADLACAEGAIELLVD
jgi:hypothetical protein